jgi:hypothetical protein
MFPWRHAAKNLRGDAPVRSLWYEASIVAKLSRTPPQVHALAPAHLAQTAPSVPGV